MALIFKPGFFYQKGAKTLRNKSKVTRHKSKGKK